MPGGLNNKLIAEKERFLDTHHIAFIATHDLAGGSGNYIRAFCFPFEINKARHHRFVEYVDFCFTDTINGCTFVVDQNQVTPFISHYDYATSGTVDQAKTDRHITNRYNTPTRQVGAVLRRGDYETGPVMEYKVTMMGIRAANRRWHFYYQRRSQDLISTPTDSNLQSVGVAMRVTLI